MARETFPRSHVRTVLRFSASFTRHLLPFCGFGPDSKAAEGCRTPKPAGIRGPGRIATRRALRVPFPPSLSELRRDKPPFSLRCPLDLCPLSSAFFGLGKLPHYPPHPPISGAACLSPPPIPAGAGLALSAGQADEGRAGAGGRSGLRGALVAVGVLKGGV
jgi:hypothetical protein